MVVLDTVIHPDYLPGVCRVGCQRGFCLVQHSAEFSEQVVQPHGEAAFEYID